MKYCVTISRTGYLFIEAESKREAIDIANNQITDKVGWSDDWIVTDVMECDSSIKEECKCNII